MSYRIIQNILDSTLDSVVGIPTVVHENDAKSQCNNNRYIRTTLLTTETDDASIGLQGFDRFSGIYQIDLYYPNSEGSDSSNYMIDRIIESFPKRTLLTQDSIQLRIKNHWKGKTPSSDNKFTPNVAIEWETFVAR